MPPSRRGHVTVSKGAQSVLSFGNTKVTKPSTHSSSKDKPKSTTTSPSSKIIEPSSPKLTPGHVSSEAAIVSRTKIEIEKEKTEEEIKAEKITDAQIKKYWRTRENERSAPRVHQEDLKDEEKVLRLFDMSSQFGPAIGIARMKRWVRANKLGLNPPIEVLAVLLKEEKKGNTRIERAYVDELMSNQFAIGEA